MFKKNSFPYAVATLTLISVICPCAAIAENLQIAVAANFIAPMQKIAAQFENDTGHKLTIISGATGKFYAQIKHGAPFDIFLSADDETPERLEKEGVAIAGSRFTYALGRLALWSARPGLVDERGNVLNKSDWQYLALANPKLAPYGAAATETITTLGLTNLLQKKFVQAENIAQAYQFVATGNAALGFVAVSQIYENGQLKSGSAWVVPKNLYTPIRQDGVILNSAKAKPAAAAFVHYLQTDKIKTLIKSHGYDI